MPAASGERRVVVSPSGGGPGVRTLVFTIMDDDGQMYEARQQVISVADENGRVLNLDGIDELAAISATLDDIKGLLEAVIGGD